MKTFNLITSIIILISFFQCSTDTDLEKSKNNSKKTSLYFTLIENEIKSDCLFCSDTQAFEGSCTCYENISLGSCMGMSTGRAKSNSYRISCESLTSKGYWINTSDGIYSCIYKSCPPEAYQAAFTAGGK